MIILNISSYGAFRPSAMEGSGARDFHVLSVKRRLRSERTPGGAEEASRASTAKRRGPAGRFHLVHHSLKLKNLNFCWKSEYIDQSEPGSGCYGGDRLNVADSVPVAVCGRLFIVKGASVEDSERRPSGKGLILVRFLICGVKIALQRR